MPRVAELGGCKFQTIDNWCWWKLPIAILFVTNNAEGPAGKEQGHFSTKRKKRGIPNSDLFGIEDERLAGLEKERWEGWSI